MGLDVYFYNRKKKDLNKENGKGIKILQELITSTPVDVEEHSHLISLLDRLFSLADSRDDTYTYILSKAIEEYLNSNEPCLSSADAVGYFRKFWYLLHFFNYTDDDYANDKPVTKDQLVELKDKAYVVLKEVNKTLKRKGYSYQEEIMPDTKCYMTEAAEEIADNICRKAFEDSADYGKVSDLYTQLTHILRDTDFDTEQIVINADW